MALNSASFVIFTIVIFTLLLQGSLTTTNKYPIWNNLPLYRGFNLLNLFAPLDIPPPPFSEKDFELINSWGFNLVRIPIDYRVYIKDNNWLDFKEEVFGLIDQAIVYGMAYNIHVCLTLVRIPGYSSIESESPELTDLWSNKSTQAVAVEHWEYFAERYREVESEFLSFNLISGPNDSVTWRMYYPVIDLLCNAVREITPDRLIIVDGLLYGTKPLPLNESLKLRVVQLTRGFFPKELTHYRLNERNSNSSLWPLPHWPFLGVSAFLSPGDHTHQIIINSKLPLTEGHVLSIEAHQFYNFAEYKVRVDGTVVCEKDFKRDSGDIDNIYNIEDENKYNCSIDKGGRVIAISVDSGGWLSFKSLNLTPSSSPRLSLGPNNFQFMAPQLYNITYNESTHTLSTNQSDNPQQYIYNAEVEEWKNLEKEGVGVIVGEWGCFKDTPYKDTLLWMQDLLQIYDAARWGWALNLKGGFGVIDSGRNTTTHVNQDGQIVDDDMKKLLVKHNVINSYNPNNTESITQ